MKSHAVEATRRLRSHPGVIFQLEYVLCGKPKCKCRLGVLHGPYWYAYRWNRRLRRHTSKYVGKELPKK